MLGNLRRGAAILAAAEGLWGCLAVIWPQLLILCDGVRAVLIGLVTHKTGGRGMGILPRAAAGLWQLLFSGTWRLPLLLFALGEAIFAAELVALPEDGRRGLLFWQMCTAWISGLAALLLLPARGILIGVPVRGMLHLLSAARMGGMLLWGKKNARTSK